MFILGPPIIILVIGLIYWLVFMLAASALPVFVGMMIAMFGFYTRAGLPGGIVTGLVAGGLSFGVARLALALAPWAWVRLLISFSTSRRYRSGLWRHMESPLMTVPSPIWRTIFAVVGAIAVSITAFIRFTGIAVAGPARQ
ncbi:hypothetical protein [Bradyrhizobium sp. B117]|uniref:hypothetical protein n=1 Tax=Bradyrhizobium sp. B117 TaxID=3140246 RepID=UPI00318320AA